MSLIGLGLVKNIVDWGLYLYELAIYAYKFFDKFSYAL